MKKLTFMFVALLVAIVGFAQETVTATWVAADQGFENAEDITAFTIDDAVSATTDAGGNKNTPKYYTSGSALRLYGSNSLTITGVTNLTKVVITYSGASNAGEVTANVGTYTLSEAVGTWEGAAKSVTFTRGGTSGHVRIQKLEVTYVKPGVFDNYQARITPAEGEVEQLQYFSLDFTGVGGIYSDDSSDVYLFNTTTGDEYGPVQIGDDRSGTYTINFDDPITGPGEYELIIPDAAFNIDYEEYSPEMVFRYTIKGEEPPVDPLTLMEVSPAQGVVKAISTIELTFGDLELSVREDADIVLKKDGEEFAYFFGYTDEEENKIAFFEDVDGGRFTDAGEYQLVIPAGTITAGGQAVGEITLNYEIKGKQVLSGNPFIWIAKEQLFENAQKLDELGAIPLIDGFTLTFALGTNDNTTPTPPTYYDNGENVRVYKGNTVTLEGQNITKVVFAYTTSYTGTMTSEPEGLTLDTEAETLTWEGKADKIVFTNVLESSVQFRFTQMEVTYDESSTPTLTEEQIIEMASITPAVGKVESLSDFQLTYGDLTLTAQEDADVTLTLQNSEDVVAYGMMELSEDGKIINIGLESPVTNTGAYQLNIPGNAITAAGVTITNPQSFKYTIQGNEFYEGITVNPEEGEVESLEYIIVTFPAYVGGIASGAKATLTNNTTGDTYEMNMTDMNYNVTLYGLDSPVTEAGEYTVDIPEGAIEFYNQGDGFVLKALQFHYTIVGGNEEPQIITLPEGVNAELYTFKGFDMNYEEEVKAEVMVGIDGQDVYIQGLSISFPVEGWAKGTLEDNVLTIPRTYLGDAEIWGMTFDMNITECTFIYDAEAQTFTSEAGYTIDSEEGGEADAFSNVILTRVGEVLPATPATPEITAFVNNGDYGYYVSMTIPATDVDGNELFTSMLSYQLFYEMDGEQHPFVFTTDKYEELTEDMEIIPYNFTDDWDIGKAGWQVYLNDDNVTSWDKVGVKSIYTAGGETRESEMFWYTIKSGEEPADIKEGEYTNKYTDLSGNEGSGFVNIRVDGDKIYVSGISGYLPDNEIVGTIDGNIVKFSAQTVGTYAGFAIKFLQNETVTFTYDADADQFTSADELYTWFTYSDVKSYYEVYYKAPVWTKVVEMAGTPATPEIDNLYESSSGYGWIVTFNVPTVDTEGNGMVSDKLSYKFFTDINHDVQPLVFKAENHDNIDADLTVIPFNFTDNWDFETGKIYLNGDYSEDWNKLGIQSVYTGGGETHESEVSWYDIKDYISTGINGISSDEEGSSYFDALGRRTNSDAKGLIIKQVRTAEGVKTVKMVRK